VAGIGSERGIATRGSDDPDDGDGDGEDDGADRELAPPSDDPPDSPLGACRVFWAAITAGSDTNAVTATAVRKGVGLPMDVLPK
jgi:hypothetical protein